MGPDMFGIVWATGFLAAVIGAFALVDRLLTGALDALRGSLGMGLVAGMAAWRDDAGRPGPGLLPWRGGHGIRFAA